MTSPSCGFTKRLIVLGICLCGLLAFSTTLSADTYQFTPGVGIPITYLGNSTVGPYGGTLKDTTTGVVSPNSIYFCLTGNTAYNSLETDNQNLPSLAPTTVSEEEAAFLYSMMLGDEVANTVTLSVNSSLQVVPQGSTAGINAFEADLGPIQFAMWYVMGTLPDAQKNSWGYSGTYTGTLATSFTNITDSSTRQDVFDAAQGQAAFAALPSINKYQVFITTNGGQNFIGFVPEPGTMVLFGGGALLMGLGCIRRRMARRPR
jgi:hypothetical protein